MAAQRKYPDELRDRAVKMVFEIRERDGKGHGELARVGRRYCVRRACRTGPWHHDGEADCGSRRRRRAAGTPAGTPRSGPEPGHELPDGRGRRRRPWIIQRTGPVRRAGPGNVTAGPAAVQFAGTWEDVAARSVRTLSRNHTE